MRITRLECIKEAISLQIERYKNLFPAKKIVVLPFENSISYLSHDKGQVHFDCRNLFENFEGLIEVGMNFNLEGLFYVFLCFFIYFYLFLFFLFYILFIFYYFILLF